MQNVPHNLRNIKSTLKSKQQNPLENKPKRYKNKKLFKYRTSKFFKILLFIKINNNKSLKNFYEKINF